MQLKSLAALATVPTLPQKQHRERRNLTDCLSLGRGTKSFELADELKHILSTRFSGSKILIETGQDENYIVSVAMSFEHYDKYVELLYRRRLLGTSLMLSKHSKSKIYAPRLASIINKLRYS